MLLYKYLDGGFVYQGVFFLPAFDCKIYNLPLLGRYRYVVTIAFGGRKHEWRRWELYLVLRT